MLKHRLVAHRGYQRKYPENTLLAMREAVEAGACYIETDIQLTRDLRPILCHDSQLVRLSGSPAAIHELDLAQACSTPANEPFRLGGQFGDQTFTSLATLVGFVENHPEVTLFVELKEESIQRFGAETVLDAVLPALASVQDRAVLISFDVDIIASARERQYPHTGVVLRDWRQLDSPALAAIAPEYLFANQDLLPDGQLPETIGPLLVVYEIDDPAQAAELFDRGVDMIETFDIGGLMEGLASHSL